MRRLCGFWLVFAVLGSAHATPSAGDEVVGHADIGFEMVVKKATPTRDGGYAVLGKIRFEGADESGAVVIGSGTMRIREFTGFDPVAIKYLSGSGQLHYQGAVSEIYGDASYDVSVYGDLQVEMLDAGATENRVMSLRSSMVVGNVLLRQPTN